MGFCAKTQQIFFAEFCDETAHSRQPNMCWQKVGPNWQKVNAKLANLAIKQANRRTTRDWQNMPQQMLYIYRWKYLDYKKNSSKVFSGHDMEENDAWVWNLSRNSSSAPSYECYWLYFKKKIVFVYIVGSENYGGKRWRPSSLLIVTVAGVFICCNFMNNATKIIFGCQMSNPLHYTFDIFKW